MFPPPRDHLTQRLSLTLGDILGDEFGNVATNGWKEEDTIDLYLDPLRRHINKAVRRHLASPGDFEQPGV